MDKPQCCEDEMSFLMDNRVRGAFECLHCGKLVVRDKRTGEETWYAEIFNPHDVMKPKVTLSMPQTEDDSGYEF